MRRSAKKQVICSPPPRPCRKAITKSISKARPAHSLFAWHNDDIWTAISRFLDAKGVVSLAATSRRFYELMMDSSIWKSICLRDLRVPPPREPLNFSWKDLYISAFNGSHSYSFRQVEKHIDWMRIGALCFESGMVLVTDKLSEVVSSFSNNKFNLPTGSGLISNVKKGIWISDLQLVRCPVCNLKTCEDIRHLELFLHKEYKEGSWEYREMGSHIVQRNCSAAMAGIFDAMLIETNSTSELLDLKSWTGKPGEWEPKVKISLHATAVSTNLQDNEGIHVRYHMMKAGDGGPVVAIRVSQQLI
ncbi:hypothetical protein SUGI_0624370 [Cryptomeria japonica]|uniref:probable F-box protein At3g61730 isoform X2 n=1 Tax=Cryptomeria japonica TaxID=3369 RepID=UPI002414CF9B|nr:probable F-box protein At3g61730 isoform X2 [Cryptomeria japonica]GLJ31159.1 hypothetical protein SUGI_0624370 [Cryptomeria japonica]